ncbi:MAG: hypothetical protein ACYDCD_02620 [Candidatus Acidiferrales bacterium]
MMKRLLFLLLLFAAPLFAQVQAPAPYLPTETGTANYITNGNFNGNTTGWTVAPCGSFDGTHNAPGSVGSVDFTGCGTGTVTALYQAAPAIGSHRFFAFQFYVLTDSAFNGSVYCDATAPTYGSVSIGSGERYDTANYGNMQWTLQECLYPTSVFLYGGQAVSVRIHVKNETAGNVWISGVSLVDQWVPVQTFVQWPVFPYRLWSDKTPASFLCNGGVTSAEEVCGVTEIDPPPGLTASSLTINVATTSTCASPLSQSQTITSPVAKQHWNFSGAGLMNGTTYYACTKVTWSNSTTSTYASWAFDPAAAGAETGYMNWFDSDLALVHNQVRTIVFGTYDRPSGTYRGSGQLWATGTSCNPNQATAAACYINDIQGMGNWAPQAQLTGTSTTRENGGIAYADYSASKFNAVLNFNPVSAIDPISGSDQLTPYMAALQSFGVNNILITNNYYGTAEGGTASTPTGPASPSLTTASTGGAISAAFVCYEVSDLASNGGGFGETPPSTPVCNPTTLSGSTNKAQVTTPAASTQRTVAYFVYGAASTSSTPPAQSAFYIQGRTAIPFLPGTTVTLTNMDTGGKQPSSAPSSVAPSLTFNTTGGSINGNTEPWVFVSLSNATTTYYSQNGSSYPQQGFNGPAASNATALTGTTNQVVVPTPACTGANGQGYFVFAGTNTTNSQPTLYLQGSNSATIACGTTDTLNSISTGGSFSSLNNGDQTWGQYRPGWAGSILDPAMWTDTATTMHGNVGALAFYGADESDAQTSAGNFYQEQTLHSVAPDVPMFNLLISDTGQFLWRDVDDVVGIDAYAYGNAADAEDWWSGQRARSCLLPNGFGDQMAVLTDCLVSEIDVETDQTMRQIFGSRPMWHTAMEYDLGPIRGYTYGEMRRSLYKQMIGCQNWGDIGCGNLTWGWVSSSGMEAQWFIQHNWGSYYSVLRAFDEFTGDDAMWLTDVSDSTELATEFTGVGANTVDSASGRDVTNGKIITNVRTDTATATVCGASSGYDNTTNFPFGPVQAVAKKLSDGTLDILFNNLCGISAYNAFFTLNPSVIPAGQTIATVKSSVGSATATISSNIIEIAAPNTQASGTTAGNDMDVYEIRISPVRGMYVGPKLP